MSKIEINTESKDNFEAKVAQLLEKYLEEKQNLSDCEKNLILLSNNIRSFQANEWGINDKLSVQINHYCEELKPLLKDAQQEVNNKKHGVSALYSEQIKKLNL